MFLDYYRLALPQYSCLSRMVWRYCRWYRVAFAVRAYTPGVFTKAANGLQFLPRRGYTYPQIVMQVYLVRWITAYRLVLYAFSLHCCTVSYTFTQNACIDPHDKLLCFPSDAGWISGRRHAWMRGGRHGIVLAPPGLGE